MVPNYSVTLLLAPPILLMIGLALTVANDTYIRRDHKRIMFLILGLVFCLVIQNYLEYWLVIGKPIRWLRTLSSIFGYSVRPVILVLFYYFVGKNKRSILAWILAGVNAGIYLTALFSPLTFTISVNNHFIRGPMGAIPAIW